jgi:signal transduction histidine kinase
VTLQPGTAVVERAALRHLGTLSSSTPPAVVFAALADEATRIVDALGGVSAATVARHEPGGDVVVATAGEAPAGADDATVTLPIVVGSRDWGVLTLRPAGAGPLPAETREHLVDFAEIAGAAIANAYAREEARRLADEQAALRRVATLVAQSADLEGVCEAVVAEVGALRGADAAGMLRYEPGDMIRPVATWSADGAHPDVSGSWPMTGGELSARVARTGLPARLDDWSAEEGVIAQAVHELLGFRSSVACPILVDERLWGAVIVHTRRDEPLPPDTEAWLANFADLVSTAVANADARAEVRRLADEQAALRRVATLVARQASPEAVFTRVVEEVLALLGGEDARLVRYEDDEMLTVVAGSGVLTDTVPIGSRQPLVGRNMPNIVRETRAPVRNDHYGERGRTLAANVTRAGISSAAAAPIFTEGRLWGTVIVSTRQPEPLPQGIETRIAEFCELVATAIANIEARTALAASRARIVAATDEARRRFERDLHDGAQQRLVSLALGLRMAEAMTPDDIAPVRAQIGGIADGLSDVIDELRELSRGIHPAILSEGGLAAAVRALARRSAVPVRVSAEVPGRLDERVEVAAYYVVSEALTNAAKHANATAAVVSIAVRDAALDITVTDDGDGGADAAQGSGLVGVRDRVEALGGSLTIVSPDGVGTTITVELPVQPVGDAFRALLAGG